MTSACNSPYTICSPAKSVIGPGARHHLADVVTGDVVVVTGKNSLGRNGFDEQIEQMCNSSNNKVVRLFVSHEPSVELIDQLAENIRGKKFCSVVGLGGGSVIDAAKALSAMAFEKESIAEYLEGVGSKKPSGNRLRLIAVPTTAGTGSEATKNAVISKSGPNGFKKSLRHDAYIPDVALIDPEFLYSTPVETLAACGLDALTQLIESYVSTAATPYTDTLIEGALAGVCGVFESLGSLQKHQFTALHYAAFISGISLANAGLGTVHGIAGPLGGLIDIPHGYACALLLGPVTEATVRAGGAIEKYARISTLLGLNSSSDPRKAAMALVEKLHSFRASYLQRTLKSFGATPGLLQLAAEKSENKYNPYKLQKPLIGRILAELL